MIITPHIHKVSEESLKPEKWYSMDKYTSSFVKLLTLSISLVKTVEMKDNNKHSNKHKDCFSFPNKQKNGRLLYHAKQIQ